jgi:recombinational DNA repair ATPase RecF
LGETPLVLLDDCLSELDESRACRVLEQAGSATQLLVTATHLTEALRRNGEVAVYRTARGEVSGEGL